MLYESDNGFPPVHYVTIGTQLSKFLIKRESPVFNFLCTPFCGISATILLHPSIKL